MDKVLLVLLALMLAGCLGQTVHGNERSGMIDWFAKSEPQVSQKASDHCAKFGKRARATSFQKDADGSTLFECS